MRPLITPQQYTKLQRLKVRIDRAYPGSSHIFVPVAPNAENGLPHILFIGQATKDWTKQPLGCYAGAVREGIAQAHCCGDRRGPFFRTVDNIIWEVCDRLRIQPQNQGHVGGWSNLVKIGRPGGNPRAHHIHMQRNLCIEMLRCEIKVMQPDAVVLLTGNYAQSEILEPVFGAGGWKQDMPSADRVAYKTLAGRPIVWMNHPRRPGGRGYLAASVKLAVTLIVDSLHRQQGWQYRCRCATVRPPQYRRCRS